jgi:hypothetical protein
VCCSLAFLCCALPTLPTHMGTPLAGVKVLELAVAVAGPAAAAVLADWGADVIKVEQKSDVSRQSYATVPGVDVGQADQVAPLMFVDNRGAAPLQAAAAVLPCRRAAAATMPPAPSAVGSQRGWHAARGCRETVCGARPEGRGRTRGV